LSGSGLGAALGFTLAPRVSRKHCPGDFSKSMKGTVLTSVVDSLPRCARKPSGERIR